MTLPTSREGMLDSVERMMFGRVPLALETMPRLAAMDFKLGMVIAGRLSEGKVFSTVAMIVGNEVKFVSNCFTLLSWAVGMVKRGRLRLAAGLSSAVLKSASRTDGKVSPGIKALIAVQSAVRQCRQTRGG
jgi:hypothetical protein